MNRDNASPKQRSFEGSNVTIMTGMFNLCLVAGVKRRNPYSREYSTIYSSSGQTKKNFQE